MNAQNQYPVHWLVPLMPQIERSDLYRNWRSGLFIAPNGFATPIAGYQPLLDPVQAGYIASVICPSNPPAENFPPPCAYVANTGMPDVANNNGLPVDHRDNGVFFDRYQFDALNQASAAPLNPIVTMTQDFISANDGTSNTLMLSENLDAPSYASFSGGANNVFEAFHGFVWNYSTAPAPVRAAEFSLRRDQRPARREQCGEPGLYEQRCALEQPSRGSRGRVLRRPLAHLAVGNRLRGLLPADVSQRSRGRAGRRNLGGRFQPEQPGVSPDLAAQRSRDRLGRSEFGRNGRMPSASLGWFGSGQSLAWDRGDVVRLVL